MQPAVETVELVATRLGVLERVRSAITRQLSRHHSEQLLGLLLPLQVRPSHALRSLGSYATRAGRPLCIRLQFCQSPDQQRDTLLHELAHACDHLVNQPGQPYRRAHGPGWKAWAESFGIDPRRTGHSPELAQLHRQRLKPVAICQRCGLVVMRLRRLPARRRFLHPDCGGRIIPL